MSLDYLGRLESDLNARDEARRLAFESATIPLIPPGQAPWEKSLGEGDRRYVVLEVNGIAGDVTLPEVTSLPDDFDDAPDQRYEIAVKTDKGSSLVYMMATSEADVKRAMRQKSEYTVLAIRAMGVPAPVGLESIHAAMAKADAARKAFEVAP